MPLLKDVSLGNEQQQKVLWAVRLERTLESSRGLLEQGPMQAAIEWMGCESSSKPFLCAGDAFLGGGEAYALYPYGREGSDILGGRKLTHI